jgi:hypothetical protein
MGATVVTQGETAPVLELCEHVLNLVTLLIQGFAMGRRLAALFPGRDAGGDASVGECSAKGIAVIAFVGDQRFGVWQSVKDQ